MERKIYGIIYKIIYDSASLVEFGAPSLPMEEETYEKIRQEVCRQIEELRDRQDIIVVDHGFGSCDRSISIQNDLINLTVLPLLPAIFAMTTASYPVYRKGVRVATATYYGKFRVGKDAEDPDAIYIGALCHVDLEPNQAYV